MDGLKMELLNGGVLNHRDHCTGIGVSGHSQNHENGCPMSTGLPQSASHVAVCLPPVMVAL